MQLPFYKYQGTGNDFVILDNRTNSYSFLQQAQVAFLCNRRFGIGGDGLMLLNAHADYDFEMKYYNADGNPGSMCGNGGRCMVQAASDLGGTKTNWHFIAVDGSHDAVLENDGTVSLKMNDVQMPPASEDYQVVNTGSPHLVQMVNNVMDYDVFARGQALRNSSLFKEKGINVNFVEHAGDSNKITVRTYERGVEAETLSCGTGVTAAAMVCAYNMQGPNRLHVQTPGGQLQVSFDKTDRSFTNVWLRGEAKKVFEGIIDLKHV